MSEWKITTLKEMLLITESGSRPKGGVRIGENNKGVPSYGGENISMNGEMLYDKVRTVPTEFALGMTKGILDDKDVLINKDGANTGKTAIYNRPVGEKISTINEHLFRLRCKHGIADQEFLFHYLNSENGKKQILLLITGSAQPGLNSKFTEFVKIELPPLPEQKKIAEILSGIDEVIYKINLEITKIQNLKKAVINNFFQKGFNQNNMSKDWNIFRLGQICEFTQGVQIPLDQTIRKEKLGFIRYLYISDFLSDKKKLFVENKFPKKIITTKDLVMANTGHTAGTIFRGKDGVLSNNAFKISVPSTVNSEYLYYYLSTDEYWLEVRRLFNTAGQPHVGHGNIANIKFLCPPLEDQEKIVSIINSMEFNIIKKNQKVLSLISLKKSVMQDLLTGLKRVNLY